MDDTDYVARNAVRKEIEESCVRIIRYIDDPNLKFIELVHILNIVTEAEKIFLPFDV